MKYLRILSILLFCTVGHHGLAAQYSINDLKILSSEKNYNEFFQHALDIRPSERDTNWKSMVEDLGIQYLGDLGSRTKLEKHQLSLVYKLSAWPIFKNNEFFTKKRDYIFLKDLKICLRANPASCKSKVNFLFNDFKHDLSFSFDLVELLSSYKNHFTDLWSYARPLAAHELSEFYCDKKNFKSTVLDHLYNIYSLDNKLPEDVHKDCIKVLGNDLKIAISSPIKYQRKGAFKALTEHGNLTAKDRSLYYLISFMLDEKMDEKELDTTLVNLKKISKDFRLREKLLSHIEKLDPIPDNIFSTDPIDQGLVKTRVLYRYFPEYLDKYSRTCIAYLSGKTIFPNGNPTPKCHQLFSLNKSLKLLPDSFEKQYSKATYFTKKN
jgi:hypothetical protein